MQDWEIVLEVYDLLMYGGARVPENIQQEVDEIFKAHPEYKKRGRLCINPVFNAQRK